MHKATIIPRGRALGLGHAAAGARPSELTHKQMLHRALAIVIGGRVAEELIFGPDKVTNGAAGDIKQATQHGPRAWSRNGA